MGHRHEYGEMVTQFFVTMRNSDTTEGRGGMIDVSVFTDHLDAHEAARGISVQGEDGDVVRRTFYRCGAGCPELIVKNETIYHGSVYIKENLLGKGNYQDFMKDGWRKDFSPLATDPEFETFLRLRKKFQGYDA